MTSAPIFCRKNFLRPAVVLFFYLFFSITSLCQLKSNSLQRSPSDKVFHSLNTQTCNGSLGDPIVNVTFGSGPNFGSPLNTGVTNLQYLASECPNDGQYTIANYTGNCWNNTWFSITDHTSDPNGYFMLINASYQPSDFYVQTINGLCSGTTYQFSAWILNIMKTLNAISPNITFSIEKTDGTVIQSYNTGTIAQTSAPLWQQYGFYFSTPIGVSSVVIRMKNNAPGGIGNDLALDDIQFRPAGPLTNVAIQNMPGDSVNICNSSLTLSANIESCYLSNEYQWQVSVNNGSWNDIVGATTTSYTIPVQPAAKYKYRLLVAQSGNIQTATCRVNSNVITVVVVPDAVVQNVNAGICIGRTYTLPSGTVVNAAGYYQDTVRYPFGCDSLISFVNLHTAYPPTIQISKSNDVTCSLGLSQLQATGGESYSWSPAATLDNPNIANPVATPAATTMYHVTVTNSDGCSNEDSILVNVTIDLSNAVLMPNAFTPNGDGLNDCFGVKHVGQISNLQFSIYNRWGERVFYATNPSQCWDGTYKGKKLKADVFVYELSATTFCGKVFRKGTVLLIR